MVAHLTQVTLGSIKRLKDHTHTQNTQHITPGTQGLTIIPLKEEMK